MRSQLLRVIRTKWCFWTLITSSLTSFKPKRSATKRNRKLLRFKSKLILYSQNASITKRQVRSRAASILTHRITQRASVRTAITSADGLSSPMAATTRIESCTRGVSARDAICEYIIVETKTMRYFQVLSQWRNPLHNRKKSKNELGKSRLSD